MPAHSPTRSPLYERGIGRFHAPDAAQSRRFPARQRDLGRDPLAKGGQRWALLLGITQFTLNFTFVYNAEHFITSGLVAVMFALLVVPNALLGRLFLGQRITPAFVLGSGIAAIGVALLFTQEYRASPATLGEVLLGAGLTLGGILSASAANIAQAMEGAKRQPLLTLLAWSMLWGVAINAALALVTVGPPSFDPRPSYALGILYLGLLGSVKGRSAVPPRRATPEP